MKKLYLYIKESFWLWALILVLCAGTVVFLFLDKRYEWCTIATIALFFSVRWLYLLYRKNTKRITYMLEALENNDNTLRFVGEQTNSSDASISYLLNKVSQILFEAKTETIQQEKYYELILNSINTGIIVLDDNGAVYQKNNETLRIFGLNVFTHIQQLAPINALLVEKIAAIQPGENIQLQFTNERGIIHISVKASDIHIAKKHLRILALSDINSVLDEKEIDSWIKLIRVLTHEIMNSITPITSLSDTMLSQGIADIEEIHKGLETISATGKGLISFVESYRKFTRTPTPEPTLFYIKPFMERMIKLTQHQLACEHISFNLYVTPDDLILYADENLIQQVVVNLLKNAMEAINNNPDGVININAYCTTKEEVVIDISNNGLPIPFEIAEQIFIPFFTTKEKGNGIGLSLSRHIMRLSKGSLTLLPTNSKGETVFRLQFN
ncbi:GHKL domain-containing protein [Bacteroides sp. 214]|uniref:sensor histidine kinase n=1 Tax=Bacteroides sp. 214 TaxID=2302935 RepID=UPI0013D27065|nr:ATP-binding protein [Bacteroides sp. 214]NDW11940.1 GHKL domain-containing protein [Bacteroides sp. 214]